MRPIGGSDEKRKDRAGLFPLGREKMTLRQYGVLTAILLCELLVMYVLQHTPASLGGAFLLFMSLAVSGAAAVLYCRRIRQKNQSLK